MVRRLIAIALVGAFTLVVAPVYAAAEVPNLPDVSECESIVTVNHYDPQYPTSAGECFRFSVRSAPAAPWNQGASITERTACPDGFEPVRYDAQPGEYASYTFCRRVEEDQHGPETPQTPETPETPGVDEDCVPSWSSSNQGPRWWRDGGSGEAWWGTVRIADNGCGEVDITRNRVCWASDCAAAAVQQAWGQVRNQIDSTSPSIDVSPPGGESLVWVATWFWHDEWRVFDASGSHSQAPVNATVVASPIQTWWDYGQGEKICTGPPEPFDFDLLASDADPDAWCNSHRYTYPSRRTGPGGENIYRIEAAVEYAVSCAISGVPQPYNEPSICHPQNIYMQAPIGSFDLEVYELQSVIRPNR